MDLLEKIKKSEKIKNELEILEKTNDGTLLDDKEAFKKQFYFLPKEILNNLDNIFLEYKKIQ